MKTAYLVRKNTWMDDGERKVARKIGRELEKQLEMHLGAADSVSAVVAYCAGCAVALLGRVQARYIEALLSGGDVAGLQLALAAAQDGALRAGRALDALQAARLWHETAAWDGYGASAQHAQHALAEAGSAMDALALDDAAQLAMRHAARVEAETVCAGVARVAPHPCASPLPTPTEDEHLSPPDGAPSLPTRVQGHPCNLESPFLVPAHEAEIPTDGAPASNAPNDEPAPRWLRRRQLLAAQREARQAARANSRRAARGRKAA